MQARDPSVTLLFLQQQLGHASLSATRQCAKLMDENPFSDDVEARLAALESKLPVKFGSGAGRTAEASEQ
jgi:hypothetical protein